MPRPGPGTVVVWGAGAMGGSLAAWWVRAGEEVILVDVDPDHVRAVRAEGLRITGPVDTFRVEIPIVTPDELTSVVSGSGLGPVHLAVKAHHTESAMEAIAPCLSGDGYVVSVQNGLNEETIARYVGADRTVGCFVNFGADVVAPGVVHRGNRGAVVVGELDGSDTARIREIHHRFTRFEPDAVLTDDIWAFLWGKLVYGALLFATALTDASIADVLDSRRHRPVLVDLAREVMRVATARSVRPAAFDGFEPSAFEPGASTSAAHACLDRLVAFNRASAKSHSGVWRDLAVHRRKTEVDAQIAPISDHGREVGVPTPLVDRLVELIHQVEQEVRSRGWEALDALGG